MKNYLLLFLTCVLCQYALAQELVVSAPKRVNVDEAFYVTYTIEAQKISGFSLGELPSGLKMEGEEKIKSTPIFKVVDGQTLSSANTVITCRVFASKIGEYVIPKAKVSVDGTVVQSREAKIAVTAMNDVNKSINAMIAAADAGKDVEVRKVPVEGKEAVADAVGDTETTIDAPVKAIVDGNELFVRTSVSKSKVSENEGIVVTYKVYTTQQIKELKGSLPNLTGFTVYEIPQPDTRTFGVEHVGGKDYNTVVWCQYLLYCMIPGEYSIPDVTFNAKVVSGNGEKSVNIKAPGTKIVVEGTVQNDDSQFTGFKGKLSVTAAVDKNEIKADGAFTYKLVLTGVGNFAGVKEPSILLPMGFKVCSTKREKALTPTSEGLKGSVTFEYSILASKEGAYELPANTLMYYDVAKNDTVTVATEPLKITVLKGGDGIVSKLFDYSDGDEEQSVVMKVIASPFFWVAILLVILSAVAIVFVVRDRKGK